MKRNVLIIGAGGVAQVVAHKCAQNNDVLGDLHIASRTIAKCDAIIASVHEKNAMKQDGVFQSHAVDGMDTSAVVTLINSTIVYERKGRKKYAMNGLMSINLLFF